MQYLIGAVAGTMVGFSLALIGGGGSILAVPLMVYGVGVTDPHVALGTSALAVAANAVAGLASHARTHTVRWNIAALFAAAGTVGAWIGSVAGKAVAGPRLLTCFAVLMLGVGVLMLRSRPEPPQSAADGRLDEKVASSGRLVIVGALTGAVSGFFGIGGGFLIVPGLMYAARLPILEAVGSALVAVAAFSLTTAVNYALSDWIDWPLAAVFIAGGALGSIGGTHLARRLAARQGALNRLYAMLVFLVAFYMIFRSTQPGV